MGIGVIDHYILVAVSLLHTGCCLIVLKEVDALFPFIDTAPRAVRPVVVFALIAVNTLVFLWLWDLPRAELDAVLLQYALVPARYTAPELALGLGLDPNDWWPILTNMFMHGGWMHLISNMWFLWIFGPAMEARFGRIGFSGLFLLGGLAANFVHVATHPASTEPVLGASGAIAAVIGAYAVTYPTARVLTIVPIGFIPLFFRIPAIVFALVWFGLQVLQGSLELATPSMAGAVAWWAHIGGFAFGALFGVAANGIGLNIQTPAKIWNKPTWTNTARRVPNVKSRDLFDRGRDRFGGPWG
jgi:membrane associated rhomboid family serine protease